MSGLLVPSGPTRFAELDAHRRRALEVLTAVLAPEVGGG